MEKNGYQRRAQHAIDKIEEYNQELKRIAFRVHNGREPIDNEEKDILYKKILKEELDLVI